MEKMGFILIFLWVKLMSEKITLMYVDDRRDMELSHFLDSDEVKNEISRSFSNLKDSISFCVIEYHFSKDDNLESLVKEIKEKRANIVLIDSKLYEDSDVQYKISGEVIKIFIKHYFPYVEVIVISSKEIDENCMTLRKSDKTLPLEIAQEYKETLLPKIVESIHSIHENQFINELMVENQVFEKFVSDRITASIDFNDDYSSLKKEDIDELIKAFKDVQRKIDEL